MFLSLRFAFMFGALCLSVLTSTGHARAESERMTLYEVKNFFAAYDDAVSRPDMGIGVSFLENNVSSRAAFNTTVMAPDYNRGYGYDQASYSAYPSYAMSYRYPSPYGAGAYMKPVSRYSDDKASLISMLHAKKAQIPGYRQSIIIEGFTMESQAKHAQVKVSMREYGARYHQTAYNYIQEVLQFQSDCVVNLAKDRGRIGITGMSCNLLTR